MFHLKFVSPLNQAMVEHRLFIITNINSKCLKLITKIHQILMKLTY